MREREREKGREIERERVRHAEGDFLYSASFAGSRRWPGAERERERKGERGEERERERARLASERSGNNS